MGLLSRLRRTKPSSPAVPRLVSSKDIIARYRSAGGDAAAAVEATLAQLRGLRAEIDDDARWARLVEIVRRAGDPWNADDWPLGFDALLCCVPLCTDVDYECTLCPVGKQQDGMSCAHPTSAFGRIGQLVLAGDRTELREHIELIIDSLATTP